MALAGRIAYNVAFNAAAKILSTVLALVIIGFITRYLGKDGFGNYATMLTFFALFNAFGDLGLQSVAAREISRKNADESAIMSNLLTLRIITSFIVLLIAPTIVFFLPYEWLPYSSSLKYAIVIAGVAFVFSSVSMTLNGIFQKHLSMDKVATVELGSKLLQLVVILFVIRNDFGFIGISFALLGYMASNALVVFWLSRSYFSFSPRFDFAYWKSFLKQSVPIGIASIVTFSYLKADTILLSTLKTAGDVGIYNVAYKVIENLIFFPAMVVGLVLPILARFSHSEQSLFDMVANKTFKVFLILVIPLVIGAFSLAPNIVSMIGGSGFPESSLILRILIFALACIFFGQFFNMILIVGNLQNKLMKVLVFAAFLNISLNLVVIPRYSYIGSAFIAVFTEMTVAVLSFVLVRKYTLYQTTVTHLPNIIFSGTIMGMFLYFFANASLAFLIIGSIVIYLCALYITQAIEKDELLQIIAGSKFAREKKG